MQPGFRYLFIFLIVLFLPGNLFCQKKEAHELLIKFNELYDKGNFVLAEERVLRVLEMKDSIPADFLIRAYIDLGAIYQSTGRYNDALEHYTIAERLASRLKDVFLQAIIFNNKANIYDYQKSYSQAIDYYEKSIKNYLMISDNVNDHLSKSYRNLGLSLLGSGNYRSALEYLNKSEQLKIKYNLSGLELVQRTFGNAFAKANNPKQADLFFKKSITTCKKKYGSDYYQLAETYCDYSIFLSSVNRSNEAITTLNKALVIYLKNFSNKHAQVSRTYNLIGDHYRKMHDYDSALVYYQKALISVTKDFSNSDIMANPGIDSSIFDIQLLASLKNKAQALELLSSQKDDPDARISLMEKSLETIQLAIDLIDRIRHSYPSEESKMYLAENEKETYIFATHIAYTLMSELPDLFLPEKVYGIAAKAKAAILRNEISENELLRSSFIPDSIRKENKYIAENIAAYNHLILKESGKYHPDENKISEWKDELFELNRRNEEFSAYLNKVFPEYHKLIMMTEPGSVPYIQRMVSSDETMIDYLVSNTYHDGKRKLYTFIITRKDLKIFESDLDSSFAAMANVIRKGDKPAFSGNEKSGNFCRYTLALNYMYEKLIGPYEKYFSGKKLIIIPDEEISWLPFDAFLISKPGKMLTDYEDLNFLINRYAFSYGYSSSLVFGKSGVSKNSHKVFSFSPDYTICSDNSDAFPDLRGAREEIKSIYKYFDGSQFMGRQATKQNFRNASDNSVIFHLAMHALPDSTNSKYSFFLFGSDNDKEDGDDGKLYNYEISLMRSNSPMVVLSACNSGTGELYQGEGMMSLARGFLLAGASSVIKTAWEVNDEVSARIISDFYRYLSLGKTKDEAMRQAQLNFLKNSSPSLHNPYYWAAYEIMGDNAPVAWSSRSIVMIGSVLILTVFGAFWYYFRRRRIFSDLLL